MDSPLHFSNDEIREELARLGFSNIPPDKLHEFQKDLNQLVEHERSKGNSANTSLASSNGHNVNNAAHGFSSSAAAVSRSGKSGGRDNGHYFPLGKKGPDRDSRDSSLEQNNKHGNHHLGQTRNERAKKQGISRRGPRDSSLEQDRTPDIDSPQKGQVSKLAERRYQKHGSSQKDWRDDSPEYDQKQVSAKQRKRDGSPGYNRTYNKAQMYPKHSSPKQGHRYDISSHGSRPSSSKRKERDGSPQRPWSPPPRPGSPQWGLRCRSPGHGPRRGSPNWGGAPRCGSPKGYLKCGYCRQAVSHGPRGRTQSRGKGHSSSRSSSRTRPKAAGDMGAASAQPQYKHRDETGPQDSCLRREDLDQQEDNGAWNKTSSRPKTAPSVPGYYSLYEVQAGPKARGKDPRDLRDDVSETDSEMRRMIKRKTLRKDQEGAKFIDESMTESDAGSVEETHVRMQRLLLRDFDHPASRRPQTARSAQEPPPYRLNPNDPRLAMPSVIYPSFDHPHTKNIRRMDPVARWHQMQQAWAMQQAPGEKSHKGLRWNIKEQMLTQFVPEKKPPRKYVPNNYMPPPDKKRKALRWQVRMDMAQGNLPPGGLLRDY